MTSPRASFAPTDLSPMEVVHVSTFGTAVNYSDTLESYKLEREQRQHERRMRDMRAVGFGGRHSVCG